MAGVGFDIERSSTYRGKPAGVVGTFVDLAKKKKWFGANPAADRGIIGNISEALGYNNPNNMVELGQPVWRAFAPNSQTAPPITGSQPTQSAKQNDGAEAKSQTAPPITGSQPTQSAKQNDGAEAKQPGATPNTVADDTTTAPAIADSTLDDPAIRQFRSNQSAPVGARSVANGNNADWSAGSPNAVSAGQTDKHGRTYQQQVDRANDFNNKAAVPAIGGKTAFDMSFVGAANNSNPSYRDAMLARDAWQKNSDTAQAEDKNRSAQKIAGMQTDAARYAADQQLKIAGMQTDAARYAANQQLKIAGMQTDAARYAADQQLKGNKLTLEKTKTSNAEAQAAKQHEAYLKNDNDMKMLLQNKYGVDPNASLPAYKQYLQELQGWDRQVTKQLQLLKSGKAGYTQEEGRQIEDALKAYHRNPQDKQAIAALAKANKLVTGGGNGAEPAWWKTLVNMPKFDSASLPQLQNSKTAYLSGE